MSNRKLTIEYSWTEAERELRERIAQTLSSDPFATYRDIATPIGRFFGSIDVRWECGWAASATVGIRFADEAETIEGTAYIFRRIHCQIGWSSSTWDVAGAVAANNLHRRAIDFAAAIENLFRDTYWMLEDGE